MVILDFIEAKNLVLDSTPMQVKFVHHMYVQLPKCLWDQYLNLNIFIELCDDSELLLVRDSKPSTFSL